MGFILSYLYSIIYPTYLLLCKNITNECVNIKTHLSITPRFVSAQRHIMTATLERWSFRKLFRLTEDCFCPQSGKDGTVSVFHIKNRKVLFTMLKYNAPPGRIESHTEGILFSATPHGDSSGCYPFKLQNTQGEDMRVYLKRADRRHIIVTNSHSQDGVGKGPKWCSDLVAASVVC
jgi:hypothetical protein